MKINTILKIKRKSIGLKQKQIAEQAKITVRNYQRIENGSQEPKVSVAILIAQALHTKVEEIFPLPQRQLTGEGEPDGNQVQNK